MREMGRPCDRCDELLDELTRVRAQLAAERETSSELRWSRDHTLSNYQRVRDELLKLQAQRPSLG